MPDNQAAADTAVEKLESVSWLPEWATTLLGKAHNGLGPTVMVDVLVLAAGSLLWCAMKYCFCMFNDKHELQSMTERAYILFLRTCRDMLVSLSVVTAIFVLPCWGTEPFSFWNEPMPLSMEDPIEIWIVCLMTVVQGVIALVFLQRFQRMMLPLDTYRSALHSHPSLNAAEKMSKTLWLTDLPVADKQTGKQWKLSKEDFEKVQGDIAEALQQDLKDAGEHHGKNRHWPFRDSGDERTYTVSRDFTMQSEEDAPGVASIDIVHVAPVVDRWYTLSRQLREAMDRDAAYDKLSRAARGSGCLRNLRSRWYAWQSEGYHRRCDHLSYELERMDKGPKRMSGHAFVTFKEPADQVHFLRKKPPCWTCDQNNYFKFGRPPFASVTLRCMRAPHPTDVIWQNLQVTRSCRKVTLALCIAALAVVMIALSTFISWASDLESTLRSFEQSFGEQLKVMLRAWGLKDEKFSQWWQNISAELSAVALLAVNSLLLPFFIYWIAVATRQPLHSTEEIVQLHLNLVFLTLNTLVIPLIAKGHPQEGLPWLVKAIMKTPVAEWAPRALGHVQQWSRTGLTSVEYSRELQNFLLRYIVNSALLSNTISLVPFPQIIYRACARALAVTQRDAQDAESLWPFAWGYWYAWAISLLTVCLVQCGLIPLALPCSALFFSLRHSVDHHNLTYGVFSRAFESEGTFVPRVLHYTRCIIATWWFIMGLFICLKVEEVDQNGGWDESFVPSPLLVDVIAITLIILALLMFVTSHWTLRETIHELTYETVREVLSNEPAHIFDYKRTKWLFPGNHLDRAFSCIFGDVELRPPGIQLVATEPPPGDPDACQMLWDAREVIIKDAELPSEILWVKPGVKHVAKGERYL